VVRAVLLVAITCSPSVASEPDGAAHYRKTVAPILEEFCARCHTDKTAKGGVAFDRPEAELLKDRELWLKALKVLRAGMMPPQGKPRPTAEQLARVEEWIKRSAFGIDPKNPDPGRVTLRRLNRVEYRNTIRDLMGIDFNTDAVFPADDTGHGFDNIGDVLTISPLLLEKYVAAARSIVSQSVPTVPWVPAEKRIPGQRFKPAGDAAATTGDGFLPLSYYKPATVTHTFKAEHTGRYQLLLDLTANETFVDGVFDYNKCRLTLKADGKVLHQQEYSRQGGKPYRYELDADWKTGDHELTLELEPLTKEKQIRSLTLRVVAVTVRGPLEKEHWVRPPNYERYFPGTVPEGVAKRREYARAFLEKFATKAFRRPADHATLDRLVKLAETHSAAPGRTFEAGIAQAVTVVLASPRFLFREEGTSRVRPIRTRSSTSTRSPRGSPTPSGRVCPTTSCSASRPGTSSGRTCPRRSGGCWPTRGPVSSCGTSSDSGSWPARSIPSRSTPAPSSRGTRRRTRRPSNSGRGSGNSSASRRTASPRRRRRNWRRSAGRSSGDSVASRSSS
jgi:hypothetical protein